jgi:hypothetical protein
MGKAAINGLDTILKEKAINCDAYSSLLIGIVIQAMLDDDVRFMRSDAVEKILGKLGFDAEKWRNEFFKSRRKANNPNNN